MISIVEALFKFNLKLKKGALHKDLHIPIGEEIPKKDLVVKPGDSEKLRKRKQFAINAAKWRKK